MMGLGKKGIADQLRISGISPTSQRVEIAHYFFNRCEHLSADQILEGVNREYPAVSRGTVYNAMKLMVEKDLVLEVIAAPGKIFYDPNPIPHFHIFYVDRGTLEDIPPSAIEIKNFELSQPCRLERVDVVVRVRG